MGRTLTETIGSVGWPCLKQNGFAKGCTRMRRTVWMVVLVGVVATGCLMGPELASAAHSGVYLDAGEFASLGAFDPDGTVVLTTGEEEAYLSVGGTPMYYGVLFTNAGTTNWVFTFSSFRLQSSYSMELSPNNGNRGRPVYFLSQSTMAVEGYVGVAGGPGANYSYEMGSGAGDTSWSGGNGGNYDISTVAQAGAGPGGGGAGDYPGDQTTGSAGGGGANGGAGGAGGRWTGNTAGGVAYGDLAVSMIGGSGGGGGSYYYDPGMSGYWDDPDPEDEDPGNWIDGDPPTWENGSGGGGGGGAVAFGAKGNLSVTGTIAADGGLGGENNSGGAGGGGAGGAILLYGYQVSVSGSVSALGGQGGASNSGSGYYGGGGGGGLIGIYCRDSYSVEGITSVTGGGGYEAGGDGVTEIAQDDDVPATVSTMTCDVLPDRGPYAGGNVVVITNCVPNIGDGTDITNVTFDGVAVSSLSGQGANWVAVVAPPSMSMAPVDISIDSTTQGNHLRLDVYSYNPQGSIFGGKATNDFERWTEIVPLPTDLRYGGAAVLNGNLYVVGGLSGGEFSSNVYRFSETGWTEAAALSTSLSFNAVAMFNGAIYSVGGNNSGGVTNGVYRFDGTAWTEVAPLPAVRTVGRAAVRDGSLYFFGGHDGTDFSANVYRYDGTNWHDSVSLPFALTEPAATEYNGDIYVMGGARVGTYYLTNTFRFDGTSWTSVESLPTACVGMTAVVHSNEIVTIGGNGGSTFSNSYRYNGSEWREWLGTPVDLAGAMAATLSNRIYVAGGYDSDGGSFSNVYRYPGEALGIGVWPFSGAVAGGFSVAITGTNLCNGTLGDVTSVTLAGVAATVTGVNGSTQIVVTANATGAGLTGNVVVVSASHGETVRNQAFTYEETTQVVLYDFWLREETGQVAVCWQTASEEDSVGFHLFREVAGEWIRINAGLIPSADSMGANYSVVDAGANSTDTFRYKLVEVESDGGVKEYGPFDVAVWSPRLENVSVGVDGITLRWLSREGEMYEVRRGRSLMTPLETIVGGLPATPPVNEFTDPVPPEGSAFYQIRAE